MLMAGLIAIAVLLISLLAVALPRLVNSDEFRTTLQKSAAEALGTPVEWQSLEVGLLPLRLTINAPVLVAATGNPEDARLTAESLELRLALLPIFVGRVRVESLVMHGVEFVVTRTPEGFLLPIAEKENDSDATRSDDPAAVDETFEKEVFEVALRRIVISDGRIIVRDRTIPRPIEWRLEDLEFEASGAAAGEQLAIELAANVSSGRTEVGRFQTAGTVSLTGLYDLDIEIERFLLAELQPYISDATVAGMLSGRVSLDGATSTLSEIDLDVRIDELSIRAFELDLSDGSNLQGELTGDVELRATADGKLERLDTKLRIATARLVSGPLDVSGVFELVASLDGDGPIQLDAGLALSDGGRLQFEGTSTREGIVDIRAVIESFDLAIAKPFLPDAEMELAGLAAGKARVVGKAASPEFISFDIGVESGLLRMPDYFVEGPFLATLKVEHPLSDRPSGRIDFDLTAARLEYQNQFKKPAGMRAELTTKFVSEESGKIVFESRIRFRELNEILLQGAIGDSTSLAFTISTLDLDGWGDVLPVLEPYQLDGIVKLEGIVVELSKDSASRFGGTVELDDVGLSLPDAGRLRIRGAIVAEETRIRAEGLRVRMGGMTLGINGKVEDPFNEARFDLAAKSIGVAEVNDLLSAFTSTRDTIFGSLEFDGELRGAVSSKVDLQSSLEGELKFSIGKDKGGRLRGVSILRTILDEIPLLGGAARLTQSFRAGRSVEDYFTERFEIIEGDFEIGQGRINAKMLRLAYKGYEAKLSGPIRLRDLGIDMTGEVLLKEDLVSALGGLSGASQADRKPIRIPLAHVTNTLAEPKIVMTRDTLAAVSDLLIQATGLDTLTKDLGRALGRVLGGGEK